MTALPIRDHAGNALIALRFVAEEDLTILVGQAALTASLVVVTHADTVLMVLDSCRKQWELPGGMIEPGETAYQAAVRELREETGIHEVDLAFAAAAEFELTRPDRQELLAIYRVRIKAVPRLTVNCEVLDFRWWLPSEPVNGDMSPLDAEIVRRVVAHYTTT
jgi:8-oxo-dGTP diphosphatase